MCRKTHQAMVFAHFFNPTWFFVHEIRPIWRSHRPLRQAGGNHMFADSGPLDPAKQFLSDSLELPLSFVLALSAYAYQRSVSLVLADKARELGWPAERVVVIDEDLGQGRRMKSRSPVGCLAGDDPSSSRWGADHGHRAAGGTFRSGCGSASPTQGRASSDRHPGNRGLRRDRLRRELERHCALRSQQADLATDLP